MPECVSERGRGTDERDEWHGEEVDLDFKFLQPGALRRVLAGAGLVVEATLEREPIAGVEAQTRRAYLLARRR